MHGSRTSQGMSLLEVMVGMAVLTMISVGVLAGMIQSRRLTEGSIHQNTALTVVQSYLEQMKSMELHELAADPIACRDIDNQPDPIRPSPWPGSPDTDIVNHRRIDLRNTPENPDDDLALELIVRVENIADPSRGIGAGRAITIDYLWRATPDDIHRAYTGSASCIRSSVQTVP